jgi:hypothetical protein
MQSTFKEYQMNIFKDGILFDVNVRFWSGARILQAADLGLKEEEVAEAFKLGKKMLIPEATMRAFRAVEAQARRVVEVNAFTFPIGHAYFVPKRKVAKVMKVLEGCKTQYQKLTNELIENYAALQEEMKPIYLEAAESAFIIQSPTTQEFNLEDHESDKQSFIDGFMSRVESFYPPADTLASRFSLDWTVYEVAMPKLAKGEATQIALDEEERQIAVQAYQQQMQTRIGSFVDDVVKTLRNETLEICDRVTKNITEGKAITERTVNSLQTFIDNFTDMNFIGDKSIEEHLASLRKDFLERYPADRVQDDPELQVELKRRILVIREAAESITDISDITGEYKRKIQWEA